MTARAKQSWLQPKLKGMADLEVPQDQDLYFAATRSRLPLHLILAIKEHLPRPGTKNITYHNIKPRSHKVLHSPQQAAKCRRGWHIGVAKIPLVNGDIQVDSWLWSRNVAWLGCKVWVSSMVSHGAPGCWTAFHNRVFAGALYTSVRVHKEPRQAFIDTEALILMDGRA